MEFRRVLFRSDSKSHERMMDSLDVVKRASDLERELVERQHAERGLRAELGAAQASAAALEIGRASCRERV